MTNTNSKIPPITGTNTFTGNTQNGIADLSTSNITAGYNLFYNNGGGPTNAGSDLSNVGESLYASDPALLVNYLLSALSPAIDAGTVG